VHRCNGNETTGTTIIFCLFVCLFFLFVFLALISSLGLKREQKSGVEAENQKCMNPERSKFPCNVMQ